MTMNRKRTGIAIAVSLSLTLSATNAPHADAQAERFEAPDISTPYASPRLDLSNPILIDGQDVVIFGNRFPLVQAGAVAALAAISGALGITALVMRSAGCTSSDVSGAGLSSCLGNDKRRQPPKYGEETIYDDDGDQARLNPLARGITVAEATKLLPNGEPQVGTVVTVPETIVAELKLQEGSVLSVPPSDKFPVGQLVKIDGIESAEGVSRVVTEQANLNDVILETNGEFEMAGTPTDFTVTPAAGATLERVDVNNGFTPHASGEEAFMELNYEKDFREGLTAEEKKSVEEYVLHGSMKLSGVWTFQRGKGEEEGEYSVVIQNEVAAHLDYKSTASKQLADKTWPLGKANGRYLLTVGVVPIYLTTEFNLNAKASASANSETTYNPYFKHVEKIGVQYTPAGRGLEGEVEPIIDVASKPDFNIDPPKTTARVEASAGPELGVEATLYRLAGIGGSAAVTANGSLQYATENQTVSALIRLLFVPAIKVFAQPFVKKGRKEKRFDKDVEIFKWENHWKLGGQQDPTPEPQPSPEPNRITTSINYENGRSLAGLNIRKDDMEGFGTFLLDDTPYEDSLATTGHFSGWGTRYFKFPGAEITGFGAIVGLQDQLNGRSGPVPSRAVLLIQVDGETVREIDIAPGRPVYVEHNFADSGEEISVVIVGIDAEGNQMSAHGGLIVGAPRVW